MCYYVAQNQPIEKVKQRFGATVDSSATFLQKDNISGFDFPYLPVITNTHKSIINTNFSWGLIPSWANNTDFRKNTLNARSETIYDKPSFKSVVSNRCLIIASSYFEWRWLDDKGKKKQKHQIFSQDEDVIAFAGIFDSWRNPINGLLVHTFSMVTSPANEIMQYVHNHKKRMPVIIAKGDENLWLNSKNSILDFQYPHYNCNILALEV